MLALQLKYNNNNNNFKLRKIMVTRSELGGSDRFMVDGYEVEVELIAYWVNILEVFGEDGDVVWISSDTIRRWESEIEDFINDNKKE